MAHPLLITYMENKSHECALNVTADIIGKYIKGRLVTEKEANLFMEYIIENAVVNDHGMFGGGTIEGYIAFVSDRVSVKQI